MAKKRLGKRNIEEEGLAGIKRKILPPKKGKVSPAAAWIASGAIALGSLFSPSGAEARNMPRDPPREAEIRDIGCYDLKVHGGYSQFNEDETVSSLLSSMKGETDKYRVPDSIESFKVPLAMGRQLLIKHNPGDQDLFCAITPSINDELANTGADIISFNLDYRYLDIETPKIRLKLTEKSVIVSLLDQETGRHARLMIPKSSPRPEKINLALFEEDADVNLAEQTFFALNTIPSFQALDGEAPKALASAIESAELLLSLRSRDLQFSRNVGWEADPFEDTIDSFIEFYASFGGDALEKLSEPMKNMDRRQKAELAKFAIPRITAIVLRPYAAWKGLSVLNELDTLLSGPNFSKEALQEFAWKNGLSSQYSDLLKSIRADFSE